MSALPKTKMNVDEFLAWAEGREERLELHDGAVVAMSPERVVHNETKGQVFRALLVAVERTGAPCRVYTEGLGVRVGAGNVFEPDALVACGPRPQAHALEISDPVIVVEVPSPSTAGVDNGPKLMGYFSLPQPRALPHSRSRETRRHLPHVRPGRFHRDPHPARRSGQARSAGNRGAGGGNVRAGVRPPAPSAALSPAARSAQAHGPRPCRARASPCRSRRYSGYRLPAGTAVGGRSGCRCCVARRRPDSPRNYRARRRR